MTDKPNLSVGGIVTIFLWQTLTVAARVVALALFATSFKFQVFGLVAGHWALMILWILFQVRFRSSPPIQIPERSGIFKLGYFFVSSVENEFLRCGRRQATANRRILLQSRHGLGIRVHHDQRQRISDPLEIYGLLPAHVGRKCHHDHPMVFYTRKRSALVSPTRICWHFVSIFPRPGIHVALLQKVSSGSD